MAPPEYLLDGRLIRPRLNRIEHRGETVQVEPKMMEVLTVLIERAGEPVSRDELFDAVWKETVVSDDTLTRCVGELRKLFDDDARNPRVIETIPRVGYRLIARPVVADEYAASSGDSALAAGSSPAGDFALPPASDVRVAPSLPRRRYRAPVWIGMVAVAALIAWQLLRPDAEPVAPLASVPLTSYPGRESMVAFSPDGERFAFVWAQEQPDLFVGGTGAGEPMRLTDDPGRERSPTWSPDGVSIAFVRSTRDECGIFVMPALGGPERRLSSCSPYAEIDWSPDARHLAVSYDAGDAYRIRMVDVETGDSSVLEYDLSGSTGDFTPRFSPDGRQIAFLRSLGEGQSDLYTVSSEGGAVRRLTEDETSLAGHDWMPDGRSLVFASNRSGTFMLWRVPADGGEPEWMPVADEAFSPAVTEGAVAYERWSIDTDLVLDGEPICPSSAADRYPSFSPDGRRVAFVSKRSGGYGIWTCDLPDGSATLVGDNGANPVFAPAWSPDGRRLAYNAFEEGQSDVFVIDEPGAPPRRLTVDPANEVYASWSRDGRWIYFASDRTGAMEIWKQPAGGGEARQLTTDGGLIGREFGGHLYLTREGESGLFRMPLSGGASELILEDFDLFTAMSWSVAADAFYYLDRSDPSDVAVILHDGASGEVIRRLGTVRVSSGLAVFGDRIILVRIEKQDGDLMIARF